MSSGAIANPLSAGSLATFIASSLPREASPQINNPWEAIAIACHAGMIAVGFKLKGLGEEHRIDASSEAHDPQPLPSEWNSPSQITFRYSHPQSSMEFVVKIGRLGSRATVDAIAIGDNKRTSFDVLAADYVSEGNLPATPVTSTIADGNDGPATAAMQKITDIFISAGRLADLGALLKMMVIQKLAPSIHKPGYEEDRSSTAASSSGTRGSDRNPSNPRQPQYDPRHDPLRADPPPARPYPYDDPNRPDNPPNRPYPPGMEPPGFEDEYDVLRRPGGRGPQRNPLSIGHDDLYPAGLGPNDPIYPGGMGPGLGGRGGSGGMHPTFDDPMFGGGGPGGMRGDPQVPEGARYDPVFPNDPRGGPGGFPGAGHRGPGGGGPHNPFGGFGGGDFI